MATLDATNQINTLQAAKALAAQIQKPAQPVSLSPRLAALLAKLEAGTSNALLWKDSRGRIQCIFEGEAVSPDTYRRARLNTRGGRPINPHATSLAEFGKGGQVYIIAQDGAERFHANLWSEFQIDADAQSAFEPFVNCLYVRAASPLEAKLWLEGADF